MIQFWILSEKCHVEWGRVGLLQLQVAAVDTFDDVFVTEEGDSAGRDSEKGCA